VPAILPAGNGAHDHALLRRRSRRLCPPYGSVRKERNGETHERQQGAQGIPHARPETGWETPPGYPKGTQKILRGRAFDEAGKRGTRTRLLRFAPGDHHRAIVHDYWEEVF
jgi:hypothetical protein